MTKLDKNFRRYDRQNPHIYRLFKRFAEELLAVGRDRYSAKSIIERIRWHLIVSPTDGILTINNNYTSRYARKLMREDQRFATFFEIRES